MHTEQWRPHAIDNRSLTVNTPGSLSIVDHPLPAISNVSEIDHELSHAKKSARAHSADWKMPKFKFDEKVMCLQFSQVIPACVTALMAFIISQACCIVVPCVCPDENGAFHPPSRFLPLCVRVWLMLQEKKSDDKRFRKAPRHDPLERPTLERQVGVSCVCTASHIPRLDRNFEC